MEVLIDTWWNVNAVASLNSAFAMRVLIDTWWNVNDFDIFRYANLFGFNRYMVECECVRSAPHA